jgi:hypothetical protein
MSKLDQLPEITDHVLSGLRADDSLKYRIYQKAAKPSSSSVKASRKPLAAALCAISAVMIAVFMLMGPLMGRNTASPDAVTKSESTPATQIQTIQAGSELDQSPVTPEEEKESSSEEEENEDPAQEEEITEPSAMP